MSLGIKKQLAMQINTEDLIYDPLGWHLDGYTAHPAEREFMKVPTCYKIDYSHYKRRIYYSAFRGLMVYWFNLKSERIVVIFN
tara:strand:+ start:502 stop:750 length:249 start_codon:yes stop_codon:yes gene_type:complete